MYLTLAPLDARIAEHLNLRRPFCGRVSVFLPIQEDFSFSDLVCVVGASGVASY